MLAQLLRTLRLWHLPFDAFLAHLRLCQTPGVSRQDDVTPPPTGVTGVKHGVLSLLHAPCQLVGLHT